MMTAGAVFSLVSASFLRIAAEGVPVVESFETWLI